MISTSATQKINIVFFSKTQDQFGFPSKFYSLFIYISYINNLKIYSICIITFPDGSSNQFFLPYKEDINAIHEVLNKIKQEEIYKGLDHRIIND